MMKSTLGDRMSQITRLTRAGRLGDALALIQGKLARSSGGTEAGIARRQPEPGPPPPRILNGLGQFLRSTPAPMPARGFDQKAEPALPGGARFERRSFSNRSGARSYRLYVPSRSDAGTTRGPMPLVVMLHGCTQTPEDFAAGTQMNALAEAHGFMVAYPGQTSAANPAKCWNWFEAGDQLRDCGEPSLIAGITREILAEEAADPARVYVAGLSAGGAKAAIMGQVYRDLYAAIGVHSGLACGAATRMQEAFGAMAKGGPAPAGGNGMVPTIVFHGDRDSTVHPLNGERVIAQSKAGGAFARSVETGRSAGGVAFTRTVETDGEGRAVLEHWVVHGAGHAWSGGHKSGSFTDPRGPDASHEMVRFFLAHRRG